MKTAATEKRISDYRLEVECILSELDNCTGALRLISESYGLFSEDKCFSEADEHNLIMGRGRIYAVLELVCNQLDRIQKDFYALPITEQPEYEEREEQ